MNDNETNIVFFDGECNLCNRTVQFIIRKDSKLKFASLQSANNQVLLRQYGYSPGKFDSLIYIRSGKFYIKSTAVLKILYGLGSGWRLLYFSIIIPRFMRDLVYDYIAKRRYKYFGKRTICMIPTLELQDRFIE